MLTQYLVTAAALGALALRRQRGLDSRHAALAVPAGILSLALAAGASAGEARVAAIALIGGLAGRAVLKRARPSGEEPERRALP